MADKPVYIFHPREGKRAEQLNELLSLAGFKSVNPALFKIEPGADIHLLATLEPQPNTCLIFTSQYAVEHLIKTISTEQLTQLQQLECIAVGQATSEHLKKSGFNRVILPQQHDSEGIVSLPQVKNANQAILFKGEQGRDHICQSFKLANKVLKTYNVYKRSWQPLTPAQLSQITNADIFVFTSGENALYLLKNADSALLNKIKNSPCLVPSERVKTLLQTQGLTQVENINSANNQLILDALVALSGNKYDRPNQ